MTFRTPLGGHIDRSRPVSFTFDGVAYAGCAGDTLASALLANGVRVVARSIERGRPRGIVGAGVDEPCAVVQVEAPFPEPMRLATTLELVDGLAASSIAGRGRLADRPDPARYDGRYAHGEVLIVGGGPAGLAAAVEAARAGGRVILCDEGVELGGHALTAGTDISAQLRELDELGVTVLTRAGVIALNDDNFAIAVERRTDHLGVTGPHIARERTWRIRAKRVVLATGAHERSIAFAGNDRPGVMLAGAAATYAARYGVRPGERAVVFTNNDSTDLAVEVLRAAGVEVVDVVDARAGEAVVATRDSGGVLSHVTISRGPGATLEVAADLLAVSGGWNPAVQLWSQRRGPLRWDDALAAFVPDAGPAGAGPAGVSAAGVGPAGVSVVGSAAGVGLAPVHPLWAVAPDDGDWSQHFVDLQRDVTVPDLRRATGTGMRSIEHVKRYTTAGTSHDQGKTSGTLVTAVIAGELERQIAELGTTTFRGPYTPVSFGALAGCSGGRLLDPVRVTTMHERHVARGAVFEDVGQWKRPWFYPLAGEDREAAALRECAAVRTDVGYMDASTLGKIDVQGPDAAEFLDLVYTNMMSTLKVGAIRYGVMCHADGMVFDDGTVLRAAEERFVLTTTTGNAGPVLAWLEEWLQTEWPHLRVFCTSVTDQWATVALVGPRSRAILGELAPGLAVANDDFPFMTWRETTVAGLPARVCRISFSGELAFEINVAWDLGAVLWEAIAAFDITPYGTETMHVLRAEKGYPIIGQDTDGTVTPHDLGLGWAVSKKKIDFVGKRSFARADSIRADRLHLVAVVPEDRTTLLREGTQLLAADTALPLVPPVPMLGHVTSSYRSAELGTPFALALVAGGRERIGQLLTAAVGDDLVSVRVESPVLVDPLGERRD